MDDNIEFVGHAVQRTNTIGDLLKAIDLMTDKIVYCHDRLAHLEFKLNNIAYSVQVSLECLNKKETNLPDKDMEPVS